MAERAEREGTALLNASGSSPFLRIVEGKLSLRTGTGVIFDATCFAPSKSTSPTRRNLTQHKTGSDVWTEQRSWILLSEGMARTAEQSIATTADRRCDPKAACVCARAPALLGGIVHWIRPYVDYHRPRLEPVLLDKHGLMAKRDS